MALAATVQQQHTVSGWLSFNAEHLYANVCRSVKTNTLQTASYFTDPVCKAHELFRRIQIVDALNPDGYRITNIGRKCLLGIEMLGMGCVASITTIPGIILRWIVSKTEQEPFIHWKGEAPEKEELEENGSLSLFFWNTAFANAGYVITDAGVMPWRYRAPGAIDLIKKQNAGAAILCEVFDINAAIMLAKELRKEYAHFYFGMGTRAIGAPFAYLVCSKYKISDLKFTPFPKELLVGRTKNAEKGILEFDMGIKKRPIARIFTSHAQHSEEPAYPDAEGKEVIARAGEMQMIQDRVDQVKEKKAVIVIGDLNITQEELDQLPMSSKFERNDDFGGVKTWGGDDFCTSLVGKKPSEPLNLDHSLLLKGTAQGIQTTLVKTGFKGDKFIPSALSDHFGLRSVIRV